MPEPIKTEQTADAGAEKQSVRKHLGARAWSFLVLAVVAVLLFLIVNIDAVTNFFRKLGGHIAPLVVGAVVAYLCDPLLRIYEYRVFRRVKNNGVRRGVSLALTMITALAMLALIIMMIVPQLISSIKDLVADYETYLNELLRFAQNLLDKLTANMPVEINISSKEHLVEFLTNMYGSVQDFYNDAIKPIIGKLDAGTAWSAVGGMFTYLKNFLLGLFIAFYILASKEKRVGQLNKFRRAVFRPETDRKLTSFVTLVDKSFGGFIYGKLIDSLIIGILTFGLMTVLDVSPYNLLISTFVGVTNVIPVFGPFIGAIPSFFIVLISNPSKALLFIILIVVVQQLDGNVIGPKILGDNTGVSSLTVIIAITLCGSLWGIAGMLIGVPLFAVVIEMVRRWLELRLAAKGEPTDTMYYYPKDALSDAERDLYYEHAGIRYRYEHSKIKTRVDATRARIASKSKKSKTPPTEPPGTADDSGGRDKDDSGSGDGNGGSAGNGSDDGGST